MLVKMKRYKMKNYIENMYNQGNNLENIRRSLEEKEKYSKTAINKFMSKFAQI